MKYNFKETVRMRVFHPTYGHVDVLAYNPFDAKMQAANHWDLDDYENMKVAIEKTALEALRREEHEQLKLEGME